ncbi:asparaginase domain-containing protein [Nocardia huaxiensis]|uniref:asparaginase domain-containing protein n=1 Tax=Nocardia huaxiensis TaxID=2755382 RepID=UPI001E5702BA|nr:asparaginase domain-containing protein [Nocardia huaxiensis]UFS99698.1 asparaginase domain-containing protein [Nocardia huaxiensis]
MSSALEAPVGQRELSIDILYTGGTFGMVDHGDGLHPRKGIGEEIATVVREFAAGSGIPVGLRYTELDEVIDSANADHDTARRIAARVRSRLTDHCDGVIVIHGTDTMAYVGARMAFELHDIPVPVMLTGAQIPLGQRGSDARDNLWMALDSIATHPGPGTFIAFGAAVHPAVRASKRSADGYDAFVTLRKYTPPATRALPAAWPGETTSPVGLFTAFPGMDPDLLDVALRIYHGGVVLECYGAGTMPMHGSATVEAVRRAADRGTPVVVITHCDSGSVDLALYRPGRALLDAGALPGGDMTREAALAKLSYLAALNLPSTELRRMLTTNLLGELTDHPHIDEN